ncbi:hypothetical protein B6D60_09670, partial [candidate division KSB1 bacterium 4484_87]
WRSYGLILLLLLCLTITSQAKGGKVYVGFMIHLEEDWNDNVNENLFRYHARQLRQGASLFKRFGAKFTAESALPFAQGCVNFGDNVLQALLDSTMGVGSHSGKTALYRETKSAVDNLVGAENNRGVSGGFNPTERLDWAQEAANCGFKYIDGPVYFCYLMVPREQRPDQVSDQEIIDSLYHDPVPPDFAERIHPHRIQSATTFPTDTTGPILFLTGSLGELGSLAEGRKNCFPYCEFNKADVDTFVAKVRQAVELAEPNDFTVVYCHTPLKLYKPEYEWLFEKMFNGLAGLVDSSLVEYVTQGEIYDHFLEWEQTTSIFKNQSNFPQSFSLFQNYPNPFNSETVIRYQLPASGNVELSIYNGIGQKIRTLLNSSQPSGNHSTTWDGKDDWGNPVSSGIYIYQLKVGCEFLQIKKLLLLK